MQARQLMSKFVITIRSDATVGEAAEIMTERHISGLPVVDEDGQLVGILTHSDFGLRRHVLAHGETVYTMLGSWASPDMIERVTHELRSKPVKDVMSRPVITVEEDTPVPLVLELMMEKHINHLPVLREGEIVGIITKHDLLKLITSEPKLLAGIWEPAL